MSYWKALGNLLLKVFGIVGVLVATFQWVVKLKVFTWKVPDWVFLALIILLFAVAIHTAIWVNQHGQVHILGEAQKKPKLKPTMEGMFILSVLAGSHSQDALRSYLLASYLAVFNGKKIADFNFVFNALREKDYIGACGNDPQGTCVITGSGLDFFQKHKREFDKHGEGIPSVPAEIAETYRLARQF
jgi:hypothetical protein